MPNYLLLKDKLVGEYAKAYDKVILYTDVRNMGGSIEEDMMMNLLDALLSAQNENKPVEKIVGNDIEKFCESYFEGYNFKARLTDQIPQRIYFLMKCMFVLEMLELWFCMDEENFQLFKATTDVSGYMFGLACGGICVAIGSIFVKPFIFKWKKLNSLVYETVNIAFAIVLVIASCILMENMRVNIPIFPVVIISGGYALIYIGVRAVLRYKDHGTIWKGQKLFENSWFKEISESVERELPDELVKRYNKINKRLVRREKEEMTPEEFMEKLRKEDIVSRKVSYVVMVMVTICIVGQCIYSAINESLVDALIFALIMLVIEGPLFFIFFKSGDSARERVVKKCDEMGITVVEYVKLVENGQIDAEEMGKIDNQIQKM